MTANTHHTKLKGDVAVAAVIFDLTKKGYIISEPMSENAPYDLICDTGEKLLRIQVKYRVSGEIPKTTSWNDKNGNHKQQIDISKIDYFALVNEDYTKICYPLSTMVGNTIRFEQPENYYNKYHFYQDYLDFKSEIQTVRQIFANGNTAEKAYSITEDQLIKTIVESYNDKEVYTKLQVPLRIYLKLVKQYNIKYKDLYIKPEKLEIIKDKYIPKLKGNYPSDEELSKLLFEKPSQQLAKELGISDVALSKYCKRRNIKKPERGYWVKQKFNKSN